METRVTEHEDELHYTDEFLSEILTMQEKLQTKVTSLEAYSRRELLRLYGVPEGAESGSPSMTLFVEKLLWEISASCHQQRYRVTDPESTQCVIVAPSKWLPTQINPGKIPVLHLSKKKC